MMGKVRRRVGRTAEWSNRSLGRDRFVIVETEQKRPCRLCTVSFTTFQRRAITARGGNSQSVSNQVRTLTY